MFAALVSDLRAADFDDRHAPPTCDQWFASPRSPCRFGRTTLSPPMGTLPQYIAPPIHSKELEVLYLCSGPELPHSCDSMYLRPSCGPRPANRRGVNAPSRELMPNALPITASRPMPFRVSTPRLNMGLPIATLSEMLPLKSCPAMGRPPGWQPLPPI